ncbi:MAG: hypothetical protein AB8G99_13270 [Planctomycetaceae bacterium]
MTWPIALVAILSVLPSNQQPQPADLRTEIRSLVQQLDANRFAVRKAARESLMEIGPRALPFLIEPDNASVQLRLELEQVRERLRNQRSVRSLDPSRVTLDGTLTVDQVAAQLTKLTGNPVSVARLSSNVRGQSIAVRFRKTLFWDAISQLSEQLSCGISMADGKVHFEPQSEGKQRSIAGSNLVRLRQLERKQMIGRSDVSLLRIPLSFTTEPRLRGLFLTAAGTRTTVKSGSGLVLTGFSPDRTLELPIGGRGEEVSWKHDVIVPANQSHKTLKIDGDFEVLMAAGYETFEFENLATAKRRRQSRTGVDLMINDVELDNERGNLSLTMTVNWKRSIGAFDSYRTWQFHNEAWLRSPNGKRFDFSGPLRTDGQAGGGVRLTYQFKGVPANLNECVFIYEAPTALKSVRVPFRFDAVPVAGNPE